ncbi:MAG: hypothetical protein KDC46_00035 [Thermoleophilia bacterium]|nr:hypothetical protein [Thermoleophilia bacterium]
MLGERARLEHTKRLDVADDERVRDRLQLLLQQQASTFILLRREALDDLLRATNADLHDEEQLMILGRGGRVVDERLVACDYVLIARNRLVTAGEVVANELVRIGWNRALDPLHPTDRRALTTQIREQARPRIDASLLIRTRQQAESADTYLEHDCVRARCTIFDDADLVTIEHRLENLDVSKVRRHVKRRRLPSALRIPGRPSEPRERGATSPAIRTEDAPDDAEHDEWQPLDRLASTHRHEHRGIRHEHHPDSEQHAADAGAGEHPVRAVEAAQERCDL